MSVTCLVGSTQSINNAAFPAIALPFTVGCWFRFITNAANGMVWTFSDTATLNNYYGFRLRSTGEVTIVSRGGGTEVGDSFTPVGMTAGVWCFCLIRFISATNRRLYCLSSASGVVNGQGTTSRTATGIDNARIGGLLTTSATEPLDGSVAEWWYTNTDIQSDGLQINDHLARQLAWCGPFSVPYIASSIQDYHSFSKTLISDRDVSVDYYPPILGRQTWTNVNAALLGSHPPLNEGIYQRPGSFNRPGII